MSQSSNEVCETLSYLREDSETGSKVAATKMEHCQNDSTEIQTNPGDAENRRPRYSDRISRSSLKQRK